MNEIVKYRNEMNAVNFTRFKAVELDLLLSICAKIRDQGTETVVYSFDQLKALSKYSFEGNKRFVKDLETAYDKMLGLNFKIGDDENFVKFVLFTQYEVNSRNRTITISVNQKFSFVLNDLTANFTRFELAEFVDLKSTYSKNLYRLLKQYKSTGHLYLSIDEFRAKLDIPVSYEMRDINKTVLAPITRELAPLFEGFKIEKVKNMQKRGHPVTQINFTFKPQPVPGYVREAVERFEHEKQPKYDADFDQRTYTDEQLNSIKFDF